ncbi:MAG: methylmalonyl Co-A mutase-associated GTPase MeaB [Rubricoccaceae bacterium]|nr:methylmalonyl Co-A mutase-associated GTPase MeaB [Rubricoccaceae bacterium]
MDLAEGVLAGDRRAVARAISVVEGGGAAGAALVDRLYPRTGRAWRIGLTGPPGAGKSTLADRLIGHFRDAGQRVGVVAVDPSSPFTGGALLGDRVRMDERTAGEAGGVFIRSLAARGALGGLSEATEAVGDVLDAAGYDVVLIETVGVGQGEIDVAEAADTVVVVVVPESGDAVQAMKAGLMEIADVFAVNKAERPEAGRMVRALRQMLHLRPPPEDGWAVPVVKTSAVEGAGIGSLVAALEGHRAHLAARWDETRTARLRRRVRQLVEAGWRARFWDARRSALDAALAGLEAADRTPHRLAARLLEREGADREG